MSRVASSTERFLRALLPLSLAIFASSSCSQPSRAQSPVIHFVRDPDPAPDFQLKDFAGQPLTLAGNRGKVILLNFWATWCGPCRAEIPSLIELQNKYKDKLEIVGLLTDDDDEANIREVVKSEGINYPVAMATPQIRMDYGGIPALPTVFLINTEGKVVQKHVGLFNPALYETEVRALLGLPIPAKVETFVDDGTIFLKHADRATMLPGVNLTKLTSEQRDQALHKFNAEECACGCKYTLAQCRIYDPACETSQNRTAAIVKEISGAKEVKEKTPAPEAATPSPPSTPKR